MIKKEINGDEKELYFGDLHIHSRFSRACSKDLSVKTLEKWAKVKGLDILGTGDFSHEEWLKELKEELIDDGSGIYKTKTGFPFILSWEVALVYSEELGDGRKGRRVHLVVLAPSFEVVEKINAWLDTKGRRDYDGRPIFKISCEDFVAKMSAIDDKIEVIPAHIWTPWFGVFGSLGGYDSLADAFKSQKDKIHAIETGISSNPEMNWKIKELRDKAIVSFSDSHSYWPWRLGREATIFSSINSYDEVLNQIRENKIIGTIEVDPGYGKYHYDGHRNCKFSCSPEKTRELNGICPKCGKPLIVGVDYRVEELGEGDYDGEKLRFNILPLHEVLSVSFGCGMNTKKVWEVYNKLIERFENEFNVLLVISKDELLEILDKKSVDLIMKNRKGDISVKPGYDGVYGEMMLNGQEELF